MKYSLKVKEEAYDDINDAYVWYESQKSGLGEKLLLEIETCFHSLSQNPYIYEVKYKNARWGFLNKFPYVVIYEIETNAIAIYSIYHTSKSPKRWKRLFKK